MSESWIAELPTSVTSTEVYRTDLGVQLCADSREILAQLPKGCLDLVVTSPPFALLRKKSYGNESQAEYVEWLVDFGKAALPRLKETGSFVLDLGGAYQRGRPVRSLYNYEVLLRFCKDLGYRLAQEFFWHNPAKLPSPIEWVNKRKIRAKDSVNTIWWFSKSDHPKADVRNVLVPYSNRMRKLLQNPEKFYTPKERPSGHDIASSFARKNKGAIPPNLLTIPNTESNSHYLRTCKQLRRKSHPARFPGKLPRFFLELLTEPGDLVVDIFSGSNTTGWEAERIGRHWIAVESDRSFAALSAIRFLDGVDLERIKQVVKSLHSGEKLSLSEVPGRACKLPLEETLESAVGA